MPEHSSLNFQVITLSYHATCQHTDDTQICLLSMLNSQIFFFFFYTTTESQWRGNQEIRDLVTNHLDSTSFEVLSLHLGAFEVAPGPRAFPR